MMVFKKGYKMSDEHKRKIGMSNKNKKRTQETKDKLSTSHKGYIMPESQKNDISKSLIGKNIGEKSSSWKGGITSIRCALLNTNKYKSWRLTICERDNYTCQGCGIFAKNLEVHHKKPVSEIFYEFNINNMKKAYDCEQLWDIDNGVTYCDKCHAKVDKFRRRFMKREVDD